MRADEAEPAMGGAQHHHEAIASDHIHATRKRTAAPSARTTGTIMRRGPKRSISRKTGR